MSVTVVAAVLVVARRATYHLTVLVVRACARAGFEWARRVGLAGMSAALAPATSIMQRGHGRWVLSDGPRAFVCARVVAR